MKPGAAFLLIGLCGCVQLPVVSVRMRARLEQTERRSRRSLEARIDCGWALDSSLSRSAATQSFDSEPRTALERLGSERDTVPCELASACAWEASARDAALAALVLEPTAFSTGEAP